MGEVEDSSLRGLGWFVGCLGVVTMDPIPRSQVRSVRTSRHGVLSGRASAVGTRIARIARTAHCESRSRAAHK